MLAIALNDESFIRGKYDVHVRFVFSGTCAINILF